MGYEYYLAREDTHELFELGKGSLHDAFVKVPGCMPSTSWRNPMRFRPLDTDALARDLSAEMVEGGWHFDGGEQDREEYAAWLAKEIVRWADGHEVAFVGESHPWIEEWDSEFRKTPGGEYSALKVTGSRYQ